MVQDRTVMGQGRGRDRTGRSVAAWTASRTRRDGTNSGIGIGLDGLLYVGPFEVEVLAAADRMSLPGTKLAPNREKCAVLEFSCASASAAASLRLLSSVTSSFNSSSSSFFFSWSCS